MNSPNPYLCSHLIADGQTLNTAAIQSVIDKAAAAGGGTVIIPPGRYLTGMIRLRSGVCLHLETGATLLASANPEDHRPWTSSRTSGDHWQHEEEGAWHLIVAEDAEDIGLSGQGCLDGQGHLHYDSLPDDRPGWPLARHKDGRRPGAMVQISRCRRVSLRGVRLTNVANWTLHLFDSDQVMVRDLHIQNPPHAPNADGIDITGCHYVTVSGCHIDTCDDAVCLKTFDNSRTCENISVTNCVLRTHCVALKLGCIESVKDMRNITFSDCTITASHRALGLYSTRGGVFENIYAGNLVCDTAAPLMFTRPVHIDVRRDRTGLPAGAVRNVRIAGLSARTNGRCLFTATDGGCIENLILRDVQLRYPVVDDPATMGADYGGNQFSRHCPWARTRRAAFVFYGVDSVEATGLQVHWPDPDAAPDAVWSPAAKLANGDHRVFVPKDWQLPADAPFAAVATRKCRQTAIATEFLTGYQGGSALAQED